MKRIKVLYAIQGTGNGHVARAREIIPVLQNYADVDVLISGNQSEIELPVKPKYEYRGVTMIYNNNGGVSYLKSLVANNLFRTIRELYSLPVRNYNLVISDFEFISSWSCKFKKHQCIGLSHQSALVSKLVPQPVKTSLLGKLILRHYAPVVHRIGFHFKPYDFFIFNPIIRKEIRNLALEPTDNKAYSVYLPAFSSDKLIELFNTFNRFNFTVFAKDVDVVKLVKNVRVEPIENEKFLNQLKKCAGVITSAGFETPSEVLFLKKKLLVVPIEGQYEQLMNAKALEDLGVKVLRHLNGENKPEIRAWLETENSLEYHFPDETDRIIQNEILPFAV